jgi:hypothetical protein
LRVIAIEPTGNRTGLENGKGTLPVEFDAS